MASCVRGKSSFPWFRIRSSTWGRIFNNQISFIRLQIKEQAEKSLWTVVYKYLGNSIMMVSVVHIICLTFMACSFIRDITLSEEYRMMKYLYSKKNIDNFQRNLRQYYPHRQRISKQVFASEDTTIADSQYSIWFS